jgi:putative membrane protein
MGEPAASTLHRGVVPPPEACMTRAILTSVVICFTVFTGVTAAQVEDRVPNRAEPMTDASFMRHARAAGQAETDLAELAQARAQDEGVKALASAIKTEHAQTAVDLKTLAASKRVDLPAPTGLDELTRDEFSRLSGAAFDRAYLDRTVQDHRQTIANFIQASNSADDDVRAFAQKVLPTLSDHQRRAEELQKQFGERAKAR